MASFFIDKTPNSSPSLSETCTDNPSLVKRTNAEHVRFYLDSTSVNLHRLSQDYIDKNTPRNEASVGHVSFSLDYIGKHYLGELSFLATETHKILMESMEKDSPEVFMFEVFRRCCNYRI